ncbi:MAG: hypothetical protein V1717_02370 [Candidatus Micrarchaeota archaeon]
MHQFKILAGPRESLAADLLGHKQRTYLIKIPSRFLPHIREAAEVNADGSGRIRVGFIRYNTQESLKSPGATVARTVSYHPKEGVGLIEHRDFAPMLEFFCARFLADEFGIKYFRTSSFANDKRRSQVRRLGLDPEVEYPANEWLNALRKGWKGK